MTINEILDTMDEMLEKAWNLPLSGGRCIVDIDQMQELISDIRLNLPKEIKQAKMIVTDRQDILVDAKKEADQIIQDAEKRAKALVSESEVHKRAQSKANQMMAQAHEQATDLRQATNNYVDSILSGAEETLARKLQELKTAHTEIRKATKKK